MNEFAFDEASVDLTAATYYPLLLQGPGWSVGFQERPERRIIVEGNPTREDLIAALSATFFPAIMLPLIEIVVEHVKRSDAAASYEHR